ncbi:hypothetical protein [uncultured Jatrophihabitans sp.]|uniref:hypothetical protein n=1 Tax=uncultured Jatrophihabitans sp. TaxID=1610747 RepID=UPI0035CC4668
MIDQRFVLLGAALTLFGTVRYIWQTVHGRTKPNRVTWTLWATAPIIGFFAQLDKGVGLPSILTLSVGLGPAAILAASFVNPGSYWRIGRFDIACGLVSVAALVIWLSLDDPTPAVVFAVFADLMGGIPTLRKSWIAPETEQASVFALSALNGAITVLTIDHWNVATWAFPVYIAVLGTVMSTVVVTRRRALAAVPDPA